jgi:hypothetical protein
LTNEVNRATAAENTIATNLTTETTARTAADVTLTTDLATEVTNRTAADNTLTTNLGTETLARTSADGILQTNISAVQADVDANETSANTALNLKAPLASPTFTGTVSGITKAMVGLSNVDNTSDLNKPISTATQSALDLKVDKVSGKGLSTEDYTTTEKTKLAAIIGTNTGDQDISGIAANTTKIGDLTSLTTTVKSNLVAAVNEIEAGKASLASPTLTGTPVAPTAAAGTNTTQIATTAFVSDAISTLSTSDATTTVKGKIQLAGDLSGTASLPTIADGVVTSAKIADGTIVNTDISSGAAIAYSKLNLTLSISNSDLAVNSITTSKVANGTVTTSKMADQAISSLKILDATILNADIDPAAAINYSKLNLAGSVTSTDITDGAITSAKITTSPSFTGTPLAPTAVAGTNTTQIATTEFVTIAVSNAILEVADEFSATSSQTSFTLSQSPSSKSKVKMYVNGIRVSNTSYSWSGTTLTYNPTNNGGYSLSLNDRIQFDYFY